MDCINCNTGFIKKSKKHRFCSQKCAAIFNNKHRETKRDRAIRNCKNCEKTTKNTTYCSRICSAEGKSKDAYNTFILTEGKEFDYYNSPKTFKRYILKEQSYKCDICENTNQWNNKELIMVLDHIDGDSGNNKRDNLRLVCPNCDSQLSTYKGRNKGNGRHNRVLRKNSGKSY